MTRSVFVKNCDGEAEREATRASSIATVIAVNSMMV